MNSKSQRKTITARWVSVIVCLAGIVLAAHEHWKNPVFSAKSRLQPRGDGIGTPAIEQTRIVRKEDGESASIAQIPSELVDRISSFLKNEGQSNGHLGEALRLAWFDMDRAIAYIRQAVAAEEQERLIRRVIVEIGKSRLFEFEAYLARIQDSGHRSDAAFMVIAHWAVKDPLALANYANSYFPDSLRERAQLAASSSLTRNGQFDRARMIVNQMRVSEARASALHEIAVVSAKSDASSAATWARSLDDPVERQNALQTVVGNAAGSLLIEDLIARANSSPDAYEQKLWVSVTTMAIVTEDVEQAIRWIEDLPAEYRDSAKAKVAARLASVSPERAAKYVASITGASARARSVDSMLLGIELDLPKIRTWFDALPSDLQERAASGAVTKMFRPDSYLAVQWADSLPQGAAKDRANFTIVSLFKNTEDARIAAATKIVDPTLRNFAKKMIADGKRAAGTKP